MNICRKKHAVKVFGEICGRENVFTDEPMRTHTTFLTGGNAAIFVSPGTQEEITDCLNFCLSYGLDYTVLGRCSNILFADSGYDGAVISLRNNFSHAYVSEGNRIYAEAGALLSGLSSLALSECLSGFEFASGIPGTLGGALIMNAGAYGGEMKDVFYSCRYLVKNKEGYYEAREKNRESGELFGYRTSYFKQHGAVILSAEIELKKEKDSEAIRSLINELKQKRISKQPINLPSAGSAFKRPQNGFAAKLIEDSGLKGFRIGDAAVSEKHSGFIVNLGNATSDDINRLLEYVRQTVFEKTGVMLEPEIIKIGF